MISRIFPHFNQAIECPICKTKDDKPCILIPIMSTLEGNLFEAQLIHEECCNLVTLYLMEARYNDPESPHYNGEAAKLLREHGVIKSKYEKN